MKRSLVVLRAIVVLACVGGIVMVVQYGKKAGLFGRKQSIRPPDYSEFMKIDPKLKTYRELSPMPFDMAKASGLAAGPDGRIYICGDKLIVLDPSGKPVLGAALETPAHSVAVDEDGLIYLCVGDHVEIHDGTGERKATWESAGNDSVLGTVLIRGETVFVSDVGSHALLWYDKEGRIQGRDGDYVVFGSRNIGLTLDDKGALWAADPGRRALKKYGDEMEPVGMWQKPGRGIEGFSGCCNPQYVVARKDGALLTSEKNIIRVKVLNRECEVIGVVAGPEELAGMEQAPPIAVMPDGRALLLDAGKKMVRVFAKKQMADGSGDEG